MIDAHCHVDQFTNPKAILQECEEKGIYTIAVTNLPRHFLQGFPHFEKCKRSRLALGLHPLFAHEHDAQIQTFINSLSMTSFIGEVGLDFSREGIATKEKQLASFEKVLGALQGKKKILSIHSRKAEAEVLSLLIKYRISNAIFHWYSGPASLIDEIVRAGFLFSVNIAMTKSESGKKIIESIPATSMLPESDGPYTSINGRSTTPADIQYTTAQIAVVKRMYLGTLENIFEKNFLSLIDKIR